MPEPTPFQRRSLTSLIAELQEFGPKAKGVIAVWLDDEAHLRVSGFSGRNDLFVACGLLDWTKADLIADMLEITHA